MKFITPLFSKAVSAIFTYKTTKKISLETKCVGSINWIARTAIFGTILVWIFIIRQQYQYRDTESISAFTTKLKGIAYSGSKLTPKERRLWDSADLRTASQQTNSFFVMTNFIVTDNQVHSQCSSKHDAIMRCLTDDDCSPAGEPYHKVNGMSVGKCNQTTGHCIVEAWCPSEDETLPNNGTTSVLNYIQNFTVLIKNHVYFPYFDKGRSNLIESVTYDMLSKGCRYDPDKDSYCPIFRIQTIVGMADRKSQKADHDEDEKSFKKMAVRGGVISITVKWDCNYDCDESHCKPTYKFTRLDTLRRTTASPGYNFYYAHYFKENGTKKRELIKAFGILFVLRTDAIARAFDFVTFVLNVGSALALFSIAAFISELVLFCCHKDREYFQSHTTDPTITFVKRETDTAQEKNDQNDTACSRLEVVDQQ
ncbi:P2X purinoceptor 4-like [Watersipora subatra]|uniref:P2X purinoceptor 4-like n=1 Tax=Watersipora subatra TaxID=2589382 RepID=UPI00355C4F31